jgi:anti-anti-sigma factor
VKSAHRKEAAHMPVEEWSDDITLVRLVDDPQFTDDLELLEQQMTDGKRKPCAVLDFSGVRFVNSSNIASLLRVRKRITSTDGRLVLCGVRTQVWGSFLVTGLDKIFQFVDDVPTALASVQLK